MRGRRSYDEPFAWWGPIWTAPEPRTIGDLIAGGVLTAECAALLAILIERRASIVVAAGPSGAGKTTLLTALLDFLTPDTRRIYVRGCYEPFDFLNLTDPANSALLVNEISPHLPIYLWGPGVRRTLQAITDGYQLLATAHATCVDDFVFSLASYPLRVPAEEIAGINVLVLLDAWLDGRGVRREVREVLNLTIGTEPGSLTPTSLARRAVRGSPLLIAPDETVDVLSRIGLTPSDANAQIARLTTELDGDAQQTATR